MKKIFALIIFLAGFEVQAASIYMCRSYNTGTIVVADLITHNVILKDRFGNELDVLDNIQVQATKLDTVPAKTEIMLTRDEQMVFKITEESDLIIGETKEDASFLCFVILN